MEEKVSSIITNAKPQEKLKKVIPADKEYFDNLMGNQPKVTQPTAKTQPIEGAEKPSLMDEVKNASRQTGPITKSTPTELIAQSQETIDRIGQVKQTFAASQDVEIKSSFQNLLRNKLNHIDEGLQIALSKVGVEYTSQTAPAEAKGLLNPIEKYLGYLTQAQDNLMGLSTKIEEMHDHLTPGSMLAIQIKVGYIQQELEFFTSLLNKALESTKTIMNVQV